MTDKQLHISLKKRKLRLSIWHTLVHFAIVGFLTLIPVTFILLNISNSKPIKQNSLLIFLIPLTLALIFFIIQSRRLKFRIIKTNLPKHKLDNLIEKVAQELKWFPYETDNDYIVAKTYPSLWSGSWGERITIIFTKNQVLINSICDPDRASSITSMGRNKKHVNKLVQEIESASR